MGAMLYSHDTRTRHRGHGPLLQSPSRLPLPTSRTLTAITNGLCLAENSDALRYKVTCCVRQ